MITIKHIASYVPEHHESNFDKKTRFDIDDDFIINKIGVLKVSRKAPDESTSDMCVKAFRALQGRTGISPDEIDCLVVCTQNPDGRGLPHTSAIVHGKVRAPERCAAFDISLGCSGYVYGLSIVKAFMEQNGLKRGLFFTADPYSSIIDPGDKNTVLLFGDAATVTYLAEAEADASGWVPVKFKFGTSGSEGSALQITGDKLVMNGRAVFNFSATRVPPQVTELLHEAGLSPANIDLFIFHQGSKYILDTLQKRMDLDPGKIPSNLAEHGNSVSSSIPMLLEGRLKDGGLRNIVLCGFGVGLSWASCLLQRSAAKGEADGSKS
jgi:3-oxoacyl-[acyl-carrier-protein] synthase-3